MSQDKIQIDYVETSLLKPYPGNPRDFSDKGRDDLKRSIKSFGWTSPILVNMAPGREYIVLSGNLRLEVAKELGFKEVPVVKVEITNPEKEREILLRMNVLNGDWNYQLLKDFEIGTLLEAGFDEKQLSNIWADILSTDDDEFDTEAEIQKITEPFVKTGEIYELGNHRVGIGDSTDQEFVKKVLGSEKVDMIYCDPLFNIGFDYGSGLTTKNKYGGSATDKKPEEDYKEFIKKTVENALSVSKPDIHCFYYCDQNYVGLIQQVFKELGLLNKRVCIWLKNNHNMTPQVAFNKSTEMCVYSIKGSPYLAPINNLNELLNKEISSGNRTIEDVIDLFEIWLAKRVPAQNYIHPTEKSPTLHEKPLKRCTKVNDVVLDLFCGSGSTLIACEQLKRRCYTIDIDPVFASLAIKRYEELTGNKAKLISKDKE